MFQFVFQGKLRIVFFFGREGGGGEIPEDQGKYERSEKKKFPGGGWKFGEATEETKTN